MNRDDPVLRGIAAGRPEIGPRTVHLDIVNACNTACVTCWDHSPHLHEPRSSAWKRQRLPWSTFSTLVDDLAAMGSVRAVVLSGMGEPLLHPDVYRMIARIKAEGWHLTLMSNLVAADAQRLLADPPDMVLVGVQGVTPATYAAFHPGWDGSHFFAMVGHLRALRRAGVRSRHVQVINRDTAPEVPEMVLFGHRLGADRVNFKLASLAGGTEVTAITDEQRGWLLDTGIPRAASLAADLQVATNLDLFQRQVRTGQGDDQATVPIEDVGCFLGFVYTRITVEGEILYCCNTEVSVGHLDQASFAEQWFGDRWNSTRDRLRGRGWYPGCDRCGKFEQNVKWSERYRSFAGPDGWRQAGGGP
jgi:MoaA/NifB/PqqE/SkfB family radical SAM enzyme